MSASSARPERFLRSLAQARRVAVITHDHPDPDAIAASWGLVRLVETQLRIPARAYAGGAVFRAENRTMVDLLKPPLDIVDRIEIDEGTEIVVVDTQYPALFARSDLPTTCAALIDHHAHEALPAPLRKSAEGKPSSSGNGTGPAPPKKSPSSSAAGSPPATASSSDAGAPHPAKLRFRFRDVRPRVISSSSMVAGYLKSLCYEPEKPLATALLYGIHTDATGWECTFSSADRTAIAWLSQFSDPGLRSQIERAPIPRGYFEDVILALQSTFIYEDAAVCFLRSCEAVDVVSEVADQLLRCEGVERVLCAAAHGERLVFSARTTSLGGNAAELLLETLDGEGNAGGHVHRAGGSLVLTPGSGSLADIESRLRARWLAACAIEQQRGTRLVAKREILKALE